MSEDASDPSDIDHPDAFRSAQAIRDAIPTRVHASMLFDMVVDLLGDEAWVESYDDGARRLVYRREAPGSPWVVPWPLVSLGTSGRMSTVVMVAAPEGAPLEPPPRPGRVPKLRNLGPGQVLVHDGPRSITITYGDDGRWKEITRGGPRETLWGVLDALATRSAQPTELVAGFLANLDAAQHGSGRVRLPIPLPGGAAGAWLCGLFALREALYEERIPRSARWALADGYSGQALAWGATREQTFAAWRDEVDRLRPAPPAPPPTPSPPPAESVEASSDAERGTFQVRMTLRGSRSDVPMPEPAPGNTPAVLVELPSVPQAPPAFGEWTRVVDRFGNVRHAGLRRDAEGFTLVGDRLLAVHEFHDLDDALDACDADTTDRPPPARPPPPGFPTPPDPDTILTWYRVVDERSGMPVPPTIVSRRWGVGFRARELDAERLRWLAGRLRPLRG